MIISENAIFKVEEEKDEKSITKTISGKQEIEKQKTIPEMLEEIIELLKQIQAK